VKNDLVLLAHGSGGVLSHRLVIEEFLPRFANAPLSALEDQAAFDGHAGMMAVTTDSYVVSPIFFAGGSIGELAINGTINDLAVGGFEPMVLTMGLIIEEGLPMDDLRRVLDGAAEASRRAGVPVVAGDTKVVNRGAADRLFINTSGVGRLPAGRRRLSSADIRPGDVLIVSGTLGDHGVTILTAREGLRFDAPVASDTAPLHGLVAEILAAAGDAVHAMRDPTRGGLATTLVEMARSAGVTVTLDETAIPVTDGVRGACELLGLDPLYVANEGKLMLFVAPEAAEAALASMRRHPFGRDAAVIGQVTGTSAGRVSLKTALGGSRSIQMLTGEQLPRIC
jgi:hydrogenase expression/formation protein HypE